MSASDIRAEGRDFRPIGRGTVQTLKRWFWITVGPPMLDMPFDRDAELVIAWNGLVSCAKLGAWSSGAFPGDTWQTVWARIAIQ